jgi:hypothetical protein
MQELGLAASIILTVPSTPGGITAIHSLAKVRGRSVAELRTTPTAFVDLLPQPAPRRLAPVVLWTVVTSEGRCWDGGPFFRFVRGTQATRPTG